MNLEFNFTEVRKMSTAYRDGPRIVMEETRKGITRSVIQIENDAKKRVPKDTHTLQRSISHEVVASGNSITGRAGTNLNYAQAVEFGRRAGAPMPPSGSLLEWMRRKGIEAKLEYPIRRAIGRRGIGPRPFMRPALDVNRLKITKEMQAVVKRISTRLAAGK